MKNKKQILLTINIGMTKNVTKTEIKKVIFDNQT